MPHTILGLTMKDDKQKAGNHLNKTIFTELLFEALKIIISNIKNQANFLNSTKRHIL